MEDIKPEEKSPLLLYVVEGTDGNASRNNKRVNFDKGRLYGISSGATTIFTEFPNYVNPCWITALISSLIFFMMVMLTVSALQPSTNLRVPRCTHSHEEDLDNKTIHLVHDLSNWTDEQLNILEKVKNLYEGYHVHLVLLRSGDDKRKNNIQRVPPRWHIHKNTSSTVLPINNSTDSLNHAIIEIKRAKSGKRTMRSLNKRRKREPKDRPESVGFGLGMKSLLDILLHTNGNTKRKSSNDSVEPLNLLNLTEILFTTTTQEPPPKTLDDVIDNFPGIIVENITFNEAFLKTPLEKTWFKMNSELAIFAARIVSLWQYAGLSFKIDGDGTEKAWNDVDDFSVAPIVTLRSFQPDSIDHTSPSNNKLLNFINNGKAIFGTLPKEIVTADDEGLHIFTKTPCHVFFGEILMNLRNARGDETPKFIIQQSLRVFCKHSAVGQNYCKNIIRKRG